MNALCLHNEVSYLCFVRLQSLFSQTTKPQHLGCRAPKWFYTNLLISFIDALLLKLFVLLDFGEICTCGYGVKVEGQEQLVEDSLLVRDVYQKGRFILKNGHAFSVFFEGPALSASSFNVQLLISLWKAMNVQKFGILFADQTLPNLWKRSIKPWKVNPLSFGFRRSDDWFFELIELDVFECRLVAWDETNIAHI